MAKEHVENLVEDMVTQIIKETNLQLVDVEYVKERDWYLRVYLDKDGGIDVDDCQWVSERLEKKLDELDPIKESYFLEVSSPGLGRALRKDRDYVRHIGDSVEVHTYVPIEGKKLLVGTLLELKDGKVEIKIDEKEVSIPQNQIAQVKLYVDF